MMAIATACGTIWSVEQARAFLAATKDDRLAFVWALVFNRGFRRGELCGLRWSNVNLNNGGAIQVKETWVTVGGKPQGSAPKTDAGRRSVPLDPSLVAILKTHKARQAAEKLAAGAAYQDDGFLVSDELGCPLRPDSVSWWFQRAQASADLDLPRLKLHDARHTAGSLMLAAGVPVKVVSDMLGHSSPTITLSIYAHVLPGMAAQAGAALSASLLG